MKIKILIIVSLFCGLISQIPSNIPGQDYYTDNSGNILINVNVLGHVKKPGTYLVHQGTDLFTILSQAGGPLPGAKLEKAMLYGADTPAKEFNLKNILETGETNIVLKSNDTIYIEQTMFSFLLSKGNIVNSALQIFQIYLQIK